LIVFLNVIYEKMRNGYVLQKDIVLEKVKEIIYCWANNCNWDEKILDYFTSFYELCVSCGSTVKNGSRTIKLYLSCMSAHYTYRVNYHFFKAVQTASCYRSITVRLHQNTWKLVWLGYSETLSSAMCIFILVQWHFLFVLNSQVEYMSRKRSYVGCDRSAIDRPYDWSYTFLSSSWI